MASIAKVWSMDIATQWNWQGAGRGVQRALVGVHGTLLAVALVSGCPIKEEPGVARLPL